MPARQSCFEREPSPHRGVVEWSGETIGEDMFERGVTVRLGGRFVHYTFQVQDDEQRDDLIARIRTRLAEDGYSEPEIAAADFYIPDL